MTDEGGPSYGFTTDQMMMPRMSRIVVSVLSVLVSEIWSGAPEIHPAEADEQIAKVKSEAQRID